MLACDLEVMRLRVDAKHGRIHERWVGGQRDVEFGVEAWAEPDPITPLTRVPPNPVAGQSQGPTMSCRTLTSQLVPHRSRKVCVDIRNLQAGLPFK